MSAKEVARRLAGPNASTEAIEGQRSLLQKYLKGKSQPGPGKAAAIAEILGGEASDYRDERVPDVEWREQIGKDLQTIRKRVSRVETRLSEAQAQRVTGVAGGVEFGAALEQLQQRVDELERAQPEGGTSRTGNGGDGP